MFNKNKIFCIGYNKTGTTSLEMVLEEFGYKMGKQDKAEYLIKNYILNDYKPIVKFCKTAEAFQDVPFSLPYMWLILREHYPDAKFILTQRDEKKWYNSITKFHSNKFADSIRLPIKSDLKNANYRYKGYLWDYTQTVFKTPEDDLYNEDILIKNYKNHVDSILFYFKNDPNFISVDISNSNDYNKLCRFLDKKPVRQCFPHLNKTKND